MDAIVEEYQIIARGGRKLYAKSWLKGKEYKSLVCIVHGFGEHSDRYDEFAEYLTDHQYAVFCFDLRGHGRSEGKRGHVCSTLDTVMDDLESVLMKARSIFNDCSLVIFGHSMGGNITANFLIRNKSKEISAAILSSPWLTLAIEPPKFQYNLGKFIARFMPSLAIESPPEPEKLSRDPEMMDYYAKDPLANRRISVGTFVVIEGAGVEAIESAGSIKIPVLLTHGTDDLVTSIESSRDFAAKGRKYIQMKEFEGYRHEPLHDLDRDSIFRYYVNWLDQLSFSELAR